MKRSMNAIRPNVSGGGGGDPYFSDVMLLAPFSDSGQNFVDYGPLNNPAALFGSGTMTTTQDDTVPLFGLNTLHTERTLAQNALSVMFTNLTYTPIMAPMPICIEYWFNILSGPGAAITLAPRLHSFRCQSAPGAFGGTSSFNDGEATSDIVFTCNPGSSLYRRTVSLSTWHYFCLQFVPGVVPSTVVTIDNEYIPFSFGWDIQFAPPTLPGFRMFSPQNVNGTGTRAYNNRIAQLRITKANRYGVASAAPIPTAPWPLF